MSSKRTDRKSRVTEHLSAAPGRLKEKPMLPRSRVVITMLLATGLAVTASANARGILSPVSLQSSFTLTATPSQVAPGGQLTVSWTAPSGRPANDWIVLCKEGNASTSYVWSQSTQGATSGSVAMTAPAQTGRYEFRYLLQGGYTDIVRSNIVPVTVAPTVSITSPSNNSTFNAPVNITINATASDTDGISKVEFFWGSTKLGETSTSPYSLVWNNPVGGSHALTAKATDGLGAVTTSSTVNITVNPASGAITGKVTRLDGTTAIAGAAIKVYQGATVSGTATSNSTGDYTVGLLVNATYSVEVSVAGYDTNTLAGIVVANGAATTLNVSLALPVTYLYDDLGRLVAVIDRDGNAASYAYDAVGNLLSISRQSPSQVSIIGFDPKGGLAGAPVNIYGTGFSATPSQNSVTFNGVAATVLSASPMLIVASVPSGATTGPIGISSPTGSATSSASFTVGAASTGAPSITSFTPAIAIAGTAVTITGTNFDTTLANDRVSFNVMQSAPSSATATSIATSVPFGSTSGHISVSTPAGKGVSSTDFFVPPSPFSAADVAFTGRMGIGENRTVTIGTANKIGLMLFDGTLGQQMSINIVGVTIGSSYVSIYKPDGAALVSDILVSTSGKFIEPLTLPAAGTYTILINAQSFTGTMTLALYNVVDLAGTISPGGPSVTAMIATPGQNARYTFAGTAGQRISLLMTGVTMSCNVNIYKPDGIIQAGYNNPGSGAFIDTQTLATTGSYTILVDPFFANTGSTTLTLYDVPADVTGSITPGGSPVTVTASVAGQNARLTFSGTAGQRVSLNLTSVTISSSYLSIAKPDGTNLVAPTSVPTSGKFIDTQTLPTTGTYTILEDPSGAYVGSATLTLYDVTDVTGTITPGGPSVTATITTLGQNARYTFAGTAGQRMSLLMTTVTTSCNVNIYKPDGAVLAGYSNPGSGAFIDSQTLPATGTYTILVDPFFANTGSMTLTLYDVPADVIGSITPGGSALTVTTSVPGQNARLTFSGAAGQRVSLSLTNVTISSSYVSISKPDSTNLVAPTFVSTSGKFIDAQTLPTTGTYTILIDPSNNGTGNMTVTLYDVPVNGNSAISLGGASVTVTTTVPGQNAGLSFSGTAGQRVSLKMTSVTINNSNVNIYKPDGSVLAGYGNVPTSGAFIDAVTLPVAGTYSILVDPSSTYTGSMTLTLYDVVDFTGSTTVGGSSVTVTLNTPGQNGQVTFSGTSGQQVTVRVTSNTIVGVTVKLLKPDGSQLTSSFSSSSSFNLAQQTLPTTGTYKIVIDPSGTNAGSMNVSVTSP